MYASIVIATVNTVNGMGLNTNLQVGLSEVWYANIDIVTMR